MCSGLCSEGPLIRGKGAEAHPMDCDTHLRQGILSPLPPDLKMALREASPIPAPSGQRADTIIQVE